MCVRKIVFVALACCILNNCTEDELLTAAVIGGTGHGMYRLHEISKKTEGTSSPVDSSYKQYPDCKDYYQYFQGCCSYHSGVIGCINYKVYCRDNTVSPTCKCTVPICVAY